MENKKWIGWLFVFLGLLVIVIAIAIFAMMKPSLENFSKDTSNEIGEGGFLSGEPCGPPCFLGIVPNVTKEVEVVQILQQKGLYKNCSFVNNETESGVRGFNCSNGVGVTFFRGIDIVGIVGFDPPPQLTPELVIAKYGEPDAVMVSSIWFTWEKQPETSMALIYKDINATLSMGTQEGNVFNLTATMPIRSISYVAPGFPTPAEDQAGNNYLSSWHGYGEYNDPTNP
jgi:hypothetical protein